MVDAFLGADIELALEDEVVGGHGGANQAFTGLENTVGLTPQAFLSPIRLPAPRAGMINLARH